MKYRKKPVVIDAWFMKRNSEKPEWLIEANARGDVEFGHNDIYINTPEGVMKASYGYDYIIRGVYGEIYPCKGYIFEETYEPVEE